MSKGKTKQSVIKYDPVTELDAPADEAKIIKALFTPMFDKMDELEVEFNKFMSSLAKEPTKAQCDEARLLIRQYVKTRTGTDKIHKSAKAHHLLMGRVADGFKNAQKAAAGDKEAKLLEVAEHYERLEELRKQEKIEARTAELAKYEQTGEYMNLGEMSDAVWKNVLAGVKIQYETKKAAEEKAAQEAAELERKNEIYSTRRAELSKFAPFADYDSLTLETTQEEYQAIYKASNDTWTTEREKAKRLQEEAEKAEKLNALLNKRVGELTGAHFDGNNVTYLEQTIANAEALKQMSKPAFAKLKKAHLANYKKEEKRKADEAKRIAKLEAEAEAREAAEKAAAEAAENERKAQEKAAKKLANAKGKQKLELWVNTFPELPALEIKGLNVECTDLHSDIVAKYNGFLKWVNDEISNIES